MYYIINIVFNIQYLTCSITNNINSNYLSLLIVSLPTQSFNNLLLPPLKPPPPPFPGQKIAFKCPTQAHMLNESLCNQGKLLNLKKFLMLLFGFLVEASFYKVIISHCANHSQKQTQSLPLNALCIPLI